MGSESGMIGNRIQLFEDKRIRTAWDEEKEEWLFSIVDVVGVLTDQAERRGASNYWRKMKQRLKEEGSELVTNCHQLKMKAADGKHYNTDVAEEGKPTRQHDGLGACTEHACRSDDYGNFERAEAHNF